MKGNTIHPNEKITCKTAMLLTPNISQPTASRYIAQARNALSKEKHHILTVSEYAHYYGIALI